MGDRSRSWPPPRAGAGHHEFDRESGRESGHEFDREDETTRWPPGTTRPADRENRGDHEDREHGSVWGSDAPLPPAPPGSDGDGGSLRGRLLAPVAELRFVRQSPKTTTDKIDYAFHGAYSTSEGVWRTANIVFAYAVALPGHIVCDAVKWAFFDRLSRAVLAVPVLVALLFVLNHVPVVEWVIPDQWDISNAFPHDEPGTVEIPIEAPAEPSTELPTPPVGEG